MHQTNHYIKKHEIELIDQWSKQYNTRAERKKLFTSRELKMFPGKANLGSLVGRYLIKKQIFEYLKTEDDFQGIEILNDDLGKPVLSLSTKLKNSCRKMNVRSICCSISHSRKRVVGMIVIEQ